MLTTLAGQRVQHSRNAGAVQFAFAGPAGNWNAAGRWHSGQITTQTDTSDRGLANMLALLGGGSLHLSSGRQAIGTLEIAASGPDGRAWFNCARRPQDAGADNPASAPAPSATAESPGAHHPVPGQADMPSRQAASPETTRRKNRVLGCIKLLAAALCVAAVLATGAIFQFRGIERRESEQLQLVTLKSAGKLAERLSAIDQTLRQFRAEDVATTDRIGLAARMLAIDPVLGHENDIFLFSANAKFIAGSVPLPSGADDVSDRDWFKEAVATVPFTGLNVSACAQDPLGNDHGGVFSRQIIDHGKLAGVIGTFLNDSDLQALQAMLNPGTASISLSLRRNDGAALGCNAPPDASQRPPENLLPTSPRP